MTDHNKKAVNLYRDVRKFEERKRARRECTGEFGDQFRALATNVMCDARTGELYGVDERCYAQTERDAQLQEDPRFELINDAPIPENFLVPVQYKSGRIPELPRSALEEQGLSKEHIDRVKSSKRRPLILDC